MELITQLRECHGSMQKIIVPGLREDFQPKQNGNMLRVDPKRTFFYGEMSSGAMVEIFMILTPVVQMVSRNQHPWVDIQLEEAGVVPMTGQVIFGNGLQMNLGNTLQIPRPEWINQYPQILTLPGGSWG